MAENTDDKKVVNLFDHKEEKAQDQAIAEPDITAEMAQYDEWINDYAIAIDKALYAESEDAEEKRDISLPLEALIRVFAGTTQSLDVQIDPTELEAHSEIRRELADHLNDSVGEYINISGAKVYQQDIFIALSYVAMSYLYQQRKVVLASAKSEEAEVTVDANQDQPE